jgi:hypothetical protein
MVNSKPIFLIRIPHIVKKTMPAEKLRDMYDDLEHKLPDYHVLIMAETGIERAEFECFNVHNTSVADIRQIQEKIFSALGLD